MTATGQGTTADYRWLYVAVPALVTTLLVAVPYVTFSYTRVSLDDSVPLHIAFLSIHGLASGAALLLGPLQFVGRIRSEHPRVHRAIGAAYLLAVLVGSLTALASAIVSESGWSAQVGFVILDVFWVNTALQAVRAVRAGEFAEHRIWTIRNYSATFAAVLLRVILLIEVSLFPLVGIDLAFEDAYDVSVWGSFTISIFVAELLIVQRTIRAVLPKRLRESVPPYRRNDYPEDRVPSQ